MSDNAAILAGFTREIVAEGGCYTLFLLVRPDEDLDGRFKAWDTDNQEWLYVNGWNFLIEDGPPSDEQIAAPGRVAA